MADIVIVPSHVDRGASRRDRTFRRVLPSPSIPVSESAICLESALDLQVPFITKIFSALSQIFSAVEHLALEHEEQPAIWGARCSGCRLLQIAQASPVIQYINPKTLPLAGAPGAYVRREQQCR